MTSEDSQKKAIIIHWQWNPRSVSTWCDLKNREDVLKLPDNCFNSKCNCQKQITFNPKQFELEGSGFKSKF